VAGGRVDNGGAGGDVVVVAESIRFAENGMGALIPDTPYNDAYARAFDYEALTGYVRESCVQEHVPSWKFLAQQESIPCTRTGIAVRYNPKNPALISFPEFPPLPGTFGVAEVLYKPNT
jgi:hypothetical protein